MLYEYFYLRCHRRWNWRVGDRKPVFWCEGIWTDEDGCVYSSSFFSWHQSGPGNSRTDPWKADHGMVEYPRQTVWIWRQSICGSISWGCRFLFMYNVLSAMFNALGKSRIPLYFLIFSSIFNVILDIIMVTKMDMGVAGVAWATLIAREYLRFFPLVFSLKI